VCQYPKSKKDIMRKLVYLLLYAAFSLQLQAQTSFTKVTDPSNPLVTMPPQVAYQGLAWIDYDNDLKPDLFVVRRGLFHNEGNGIFTFNSSSNISLTGGLGTTWTDYDNDGYIDCFIAAGGPVGSRLYRNNGNGTFTQNLGSAFSAPTSLRGWGSAFGDLNNDGLADLFIASPIGFVGITDSSKLLLNKGNGIFQRVDNAGATDTVDAYTVPSWSDYDNDGDVDLFIGAGRVNGQLSPDYLFRNKTPKGGYPHFKRDLATPLGNEGRDGQIWNWIDFDNDGDLDVYITNYAGTDQVNGYPNDFYVNNNGRFRKLTASEAGPIVTDRGFSLASVWTDFDNDGDLDCLVTNDGQQNVYYQSNITAGSKVFTRITAGMPFTDSTGNFSSASAGDYDRDGDVDLFVTSNRLDNGLYQNNLSNNNAWVNINLVGITSNRSALGAKVRIRARTGNRGPVWQMREISAQNTFNGMNMLNAHFGLGKAGKIDKLIIEWPSGKRTECHNLGINQFYTITEGECCPGMENKGGRCENDSHEENGWDECKSTNHPNPFTESTTIYYTLNKTADVLVALSDGTGRRVSSYSYRNQAAGEYTISVGKDRLTHAGIYYYTIYVDGKRVTSKKMVKL
jgi:enediyne biosynthesis protein E4